PLSRWLTRLVLGHPRNVVSASRPQSRRQLPPQGNPPSALRLVHDPNAPNHIEFVEAVRGRTPGDSRCQHVSPSSEQVSPAPPPRSPWHAGEPRSRSSTTAPPGKPRQPARGSSRLGALPLRAPSMTWAPPGPRT